MAKPNKKRDLRARLGRTITPKTKGGDAAAPPSAVPAPPAGAAAPATPAPSAKEKLRAKSEKAGAASVTPPPSGVAAPAVAAPPAGIGASAAPPGVMAPPFAAPQAPASVAPAPADPFAAGEGAQAQPQVVRLEFDDKLVKDVEVGKSRRFTVAIVAAASVAVGLLVGAFGGSTYENNKIFDQTVSDAQAIYTSVDNASEHVDEANALIQRLARAAAGNPNADEARRVDYEAIEALRGIEKPIDAGAMSGKNYKAFPPGVVHNLFGYLMNVQRLWDEFRALAAITLPAARRAELDRTAALSNEAATTRYAAVLRRLPADQGGELTVSLAFLAINETANGVEFVARPARSGRGLTLQLWDGEAEVGTRPEYLLSVDAAGSRGVLGQSEGAFQELLRKIVELGAMMEETVRMQGELISGISQAINEAGQTPGQAQE